MLVIDKYNQDEQEYSLWDKVIEVGNNAEGNLNGLRVVEGLKHVKTPYVFLLQEDFLLYDNVDTELIKKIIKLAVKYDAGNIRLVINPVTEDVYSREDNLLEYKYGMAYRLSMQAGLWKTKYLYNIMNKYKNGADFERVGSFESCKYKEPVLAWGGVAYPYLHAIQKGKWWPHCVDVVRWNKLEPDFDRHPMMTNKDKFIEELKGYIISINPEIVVKLQNLLRFGKKY